GENAPKVTSTFVCSGDWPTRRTDETSGPISVAERTTRPVLTSQLLSHARFSSQPAASSRVPSPLKATHPGVKGKRRNSWPLVALSSTRRYSLSRPVTSAGTRLPAAIHLPEGARASTSSQRSRQRAPSAPGLGKWWMSLPVDRSHSVRAVPPTLHDP